MNHLALKGGIVLGLLSILFSLGIYFQDQNQIIKTLIVLLPLILSIVAVYWVVKRTREELGNSISFGQAFNQSFSTLTISTILSMIFTYFLFNYIDPQLKDMVKEEALKAVDELSKFLSESQTEELTLGIEKQDNYSLLGIGKSFIAYSVLNALFCLIIALIMKRSKKEWA